MFGILLTLITVSIILFAITFKMNDSFSQLESQFEQLSITTMQDTYQIQQKLKVLEEELLTENLVDLNINSEQQVANNSTQPFLLKEVHRLYDEGNSIANIAEQTELSTHDIRTILQNKL